GAWVTEKSAAWQFELRLGSATGTLIGSGEAAAGAVDAYSRVDIKLQPHAGFQDIFLVARSEKSASELHLLDVAFAR
ncbi:MAG: carbohydrate-binding protein, partial [Cellvibrio sp.]